MNAQPFLLEHRVLNPTDYWQAIHRFHSASLSPQETNYYRLAGVFAETQARAQGSSLLPVPWQNQQIPPTQLHDEILIVLGLTALVLQTEDDRFSNPNTI